MSPCGPWFGKRSSSGASGWSRVAARYKDSLAGMDMRLSAGLLSLDAVKADLSANTAGIASLVLSDADVRLDITQAAPKEEADSTAALPWTIGIRETLGGQPGFRDADGTCRIGTLRPPGRRHGG